GRLTTDGWAQVLTVLPYVVAAVVVIWLYRRTLDVMAVGDVEASSLGVAPARVRLLLICVATLGTAAVVSVSGLIGFVGIVIPHAVRLVIGPGHRLLLPLSLLVGAAFLVLADIVARTALAPAEMPIGVVTAALGAPFFLVVLRRSRGRIGPPRPRTPPGPRALPGPGRPDLPRPRRRRRRRPHPARRDHVRARGELGLSGRPQRLRQDHPALRPGRPDPLRRGRRRGGHPAAAVHPPHHRPHRGDHAATPRGARRRDRARAHPPRPHPAHPALRHRDRAGRRGGGPRDRPARPARLHRPHRHHPVRGRAPARGPGPRAGAGARGAVAGRADQCARHRPPTAGARVGRLHATRGRAHGDRGDARLDLG